jgi:hypothetical protein
MRVIIKRILRKYGYPPDKQAHATGLVLEQAEVLCRAGRKKNEIKAPNNHINSDWQLRYAPLPAGYAERWAEGSESSCYDK